MCLFEKRKYCIWVPFGHFSFLLGVPLKKSDCVLSFSTVKPQKSSKLVNVYSAVKSLCHSRHNAGGGIREVSHIIRQCVNKTIPPQQCCFPVSHSKPGIFTFHISVHRFLYRRSHDSALVQMNLLRGGKKKDQSKYKTLI